MSGYLGSSMNNRRNLIIVLGAATFTPRALFAQTKKHPELIGWLALTSRKSGERLLDAFKEGLAALGWKEGAQVRIDERWAEGQDDRLAALVKELAAKSPSLIVTSGLTATLHATKGAPKIPIVMVADIDPVAAGLVTSLPRPGGMITGLGGFGSQLVTKHLELLVVAAPKVKRVGFLAYSGNLTVARITEAARRSATHYSLEARFAEVARPEEVEPAMLRLAKEGAQGLVVFPGAPLAAERRRIVKLALAQRWPVVAGRRKWAEAGALLSYSADTLVHYRRAAYYVDRILKGANPGDIPIEQPMTFEMVVNLKTAKVLGLTMPPEIMVQATRVIQ